MGSKEFLKSRTYIYYVDPKYMVGLNKFNGLDAKAKASQECKNIR